MKDILIMNIKKEELDIEASAFNIKDYLERVNYLTKDIFYDVFILPDGFTGIIKEDVYNDDVHSINEILRSYKGCIIINSDLDDIINIIVQDVPTEKQIKILSKIIPFSKPNKINLYKKDSSHPFMVLENEECDISHVVNEINNLFIEQEELDLDAIKTKKLQKMDYNDNRSYYNKELSRLAYYLSSSGVEMLKDWAEEHDGDLYREIDRNPDERRVVISKIKPSYRNQYNYWNYYNIFGHNVYDELEWWGQIPKSIGDELLRINEDLDLDTSDNAKPSSIRYNVNFVEWSYEGDNKSRFLNVILDNNLIKNIDSQGIINIIPFVDDVKLTIRGYNRDTNLCSVSLDLISNRLGLHGFENVYHKEEVDELLNVLNLKIPSYTDIKIKTERL